MLDSVFTLTKGEAGWLAVFFVFFVGADRVLAALLNLPVTMFMLFAMMIAAFFIVACVYTASKWALHKVLRRG
jgi:hypothetical protein